MIKANKYTRAFGRAPFMLKKLSIVLALLAVIVSCKKNDSPVGVDVIPSSDQLNGAYAVLKPQLSYTKAEDSIMTTNVTNSNMLGSINDPVFGRFDASIYVNYELAGVAAGSLGTNPVLDSVVLKLNYNTLAAYPYIGDTIDPLSVDVFPLTEKLCRDSLYYSTRNIGYDPSDNLIEGGQSRVFQPRLHTTFRVNKDDDLPTPYPQLRLRLKKEFGEKLFNYAYLSSAAAFQNAMYGFFITTRNSVLPQPGYGSVFYVQMLNSRLLLYYHNDDVTTKPYRDPIEIGTYANSTRFAHFDHDYQFLAEPGLANQLKPAYDTGSTTSPGLGAQNIYVQGAGGVRAKLEFPELITWQDSNIVINKAQLCFRIDKSKSNYFHATKYPSPLRLYLEMADANGKPQSMIENVYAFGGTYNPVTDGYEFNIPHTIAQVLTKKNNNVIFYLSMYQSGIFPHRVVLGGSGCNTVDPIRLKLWYTRLQFPK